MQHDAQRPPVEAERLLSEYVATRDPALAERVVGEHLYIAAIIARRFSGRGVEYDDLYQVASLALYKALDRYDPARGVKFASFVTPAMVGEVKNYFRDRSRAIRLPRRGQKLMQDIENARDALAQRLERQPTADEIAGELGVSLEDVIEGMELRGAASLLSLDALPQEDEENAPLSAFLGMDEKGYADFEQGDWIRRAMDALEERLREVVRLRFFENLSQRQAAERLGVSQMWVSRAERRALEALRQALDELKK